MSCDFVVLKFCLPNFRAYLYPDIQNLNWKSVDFITKQQDKSSVKTLNHNWIIFFSPSYSAEGDMRWKSLGTADLYEFSTLFGAGIFFHSWDLM